MVSADYRVVPTVTESASFSVASVKSSQVCDVAQKAIFQNTPETGTYKLFKAKPQKLSEPEDKALYLGANRETIVLEGKSIELPRTLYQFLFIYLALKSGNDSDLYKILRYAILMDTNDQVQSLNDRCTRDLKSSGETFALHLAEFFKTKACQPHTMTWQEVKKMVTELCDELVLTQKNKHELPELNSENLWYHFYRFCLKPSNPDPFKEMILSTLAIEWTSPANTEILYRSAKIACDDVLRDNGHAHSLSFSPTPLSGIVFEGTPSGTCPFSYFFEIGNLELYALRIKADKMAEFFFYPHLLKHEGLLSLVAKGEFSHPRLKHFGASEGDISGLQGRKEITDTVFEPSEKYPTREAYRKKIIKMFSKHSVMV